MQGWSVAQAVAFLHSVDLDGAAEVCRHNGVNGDDLLAMTAATLTGDLRGSWRTGVAVALGGGS